MSDQGRDGGDELIRPDRLLQDLVSLVPQRLHHWVGGLVRGNNGDWHSRGELAQDSQQLPAGHARQLHVSQHQIPGLRACEPQRDGWVGSVPDIEPAALAQHVLREVGGHRVILDQQNPAR